jgi:proteasome accessory factor A
MRPFIQGTEHEYTYYSKELAAKGFDPHALALEILHEKSDLHACGEFLKNQSRAYYDVGHLELSTCETSNFKDLVIWEKAGEKIVDWARRKVEELYMSEEKAIISLKNNTAPDGTSYGSHENYCISRSVEFPDAFIKGLVPHLITRLIYTGSGDILDGRYVLSPSAYLTGAVISSDTMHETGILNTRDEPHGDGSRFRRLHIQVGDALMNEVAIALRQFATNCALRLIEQGGLKDIPELKQPLQDLWDIVECTNPEKWSIKVRPSKIFGKKEEVSPIDIQKYYLERSEPLVESRDEKKLFRIWEDTLYLLEKRDSKKLARRIEWLDRFFVIKKMTDEGKGEMSVCKRYSETGKERSYFYERQDKDLVDRLVTDQEIIEAIREPPADTRAHARKLICDRFGDEKIVRLDWSVAKVKNKDGDIIAIELDDPFQTGYSMR